MKKNLFSNNKLTTYAKEHRKKIRQYSRHAYNFKANIVTFRPTQFEKYAIQISNYLLNHDIVLVNFRYIHDEDYSKLFYFLSGIIYCLGGTMNKIDDNDKLFLLASSSYRVGDDVNKSNLNKKIKKYSELNYEWLENLY